MEATGWFRTKLWRKVLVTVTFLTCSLSADVTYRGGERDRCNRTVDIYQAISSPPVTEKNRDKPLHCTYRIRVRPARDDWVVFVRFTRLRVGEPSDDRSQCIGGYVQIVDGYRDSNHSNKDNPGFYCGEIDSPKTFISETPYVKIVFHVDRYNQDSFLQFDANVEQQREVHARYGQYAQLYPHRRGTPISGTYCERTFQDCSPGRCFVQSPGFPGIYPRNLHCKYHLVVSQNLVGLDLTTFDLDGLRCDNLLMCFPRPITKQPEDCPFDFVRIYDGPNEDSPVIVTLCGRGRLKSNIIASGPEMLMEFITSAGGPLLNTGFHFKADSIYGATESEPLQLKNGSCMIERHLKENQAGMFSNIRSWYPINTTCSYRFTVSEEEVIRLEFVWFRVERMTLCEESLKLYDSYDADPAKIISKLCDINKPRTEQPRSIYETMGPVMFLEFLSKTGSLDGSSLSYGFEVKPVNTASHKNHMSLHSCSRHFQPDAGLAGSFIVSLQDFNFSSTNGLPLFCNYSFDVSALPQGRVNLTVYSLFQKLTENCEECKEEPLYMEVRAGLLSRFPTCLCKVGRQRVHFSSSLGPTFYMTLHVDQPNDIKNLGPVILKDKQLLDVTFNFFSESRCGQERMELDLQGVVAFPPATGIGSVCPNGCTTPLYCTWKIPVFHRMDIAFRLHGYHGQTNCSTDYITINQVSLCPITTEHEMTLRKEDIFDSDVVVTFRSSDAAATNFSLWWTQLRMLPSHSSSDTLVSLGKDCDFLCTSSMACLTKELVCNGVPNCPNQSDNYGEPKLADEDPSLCMTQQDSFKLYWWIIGFGLGICACIMLCLTFTLCRRCHAGRQRF